MDLEHLTKSQVLLLALLVAIVSSVATGIVTVSLMGQAPPMVAANVGNIIERTVKHVIFATTTIPAPAPVNPAPAAPATAAEAIATVQKSVIHIVVQGDTAGTLVARGLITGKDGSAITDAASLSPALAYEALLHDGSRVDLIVEPAESSAATVRITLQSASSTAFIPAKIGDIQRLPLGATVVRIGGYGTDTVALGIMATMPDKATNTVQADISSAVPGAILVSVDGSVVGMTTTQSLALGPTHYSLIK